MLDHVEVFDDLTSPPCGRTCNNISGCTGIAVALLAQSGDKDCICLPTLQLAQGTVCIGRSAGGRVPISRCGINQVVDHISYT